MALLAALVPAPAAVAAVAAPPMFIAVAPTCIAPGVATRVVIYGDSWPPGSVQLSRTTPGGPVQLGSVPTRTSPVRQRPGTYTSTVTLTADAPFTVTAAQGEFAVSANVLVRTDCPLQISARPPCLTAPGKVLVSGTGFAADSNVPVDVDPYGNSEALPLSTTADKPGNISVPVDIPFSGAPVPIVATRGPSSVTAANVPPSRAVTFIDPCPPPATTSTTAAPVGTTTTQGSKVGPTTTAAVPPPGIPAPDMPPLTIPIPDATVEVRYSPRTVRPGRCVVILIGRAPPGLPVVARFADGFPVSGQTGPEGGAVLSVCHPHDSGLTIGAVNVLLGIGPLAPAPAFTVLRVPPRPQPPLLQPGADGRRS